MFADLNASLKKNMHRLTFDICFTYLFPKMDEDDISNLAKVEPHILHVVLQYRDYQKKIYGITRDDVQLVTKNGTGIDVLEYFRTPNSIKLAFGTIKLPTIIFDQNGRIFRCGRLLKGSTFNMFTHPCIKYAKVIVIEGKLQHIKLSYHFSSTSTDEGPKSR